MSSQEKQGRWFWMWNRLQCMTMAEIVYRASQAVGTRLQRLAGLDRLSAEPGDMVDGGVVWIRVPAVDPTPYVDAAVEIGKGSIRLFAAERFEVGAVPQWNRCPLTGVLAPMLPAHALSITDQAQVGDIKYVWELNRHLHWVALAQAWALTGDRRHLVVLGKQLESWLEQCPYGKGPNWTSGLEFALRLLNWSLVWQLIGGKNSVLFDAPGGESLRERWLGAINLHVRAVAGSYSRHSSANNHLIGELAAVFVASQTWPFWSSVRQLGKSARMELEREALLQIHADGVAREQAFEYACFIFDFFLAAERSAEAAGRPLSMGLKARLEAMCEFGHAVSTRLGAAPQVGDADGAEAYRLDPRPDRNAMATMLQKGAYLFRRGEWLPPEAQRRADTAWIFTDQQVPLVRANSASRMDFAEGGYYLFGSDAGGTHELLGLVDAGPLGYLGIAAHGHADALQVWLSYGGLPALVDPGTYSYWADKGWRDYFRGTSAHNTVRVGARDQSLSGGRFMWTRKAVARVDLLERNAPGGLHLVAEHDGYLRQPGRFSHRREVLFSPHVGELQVVDRLLGCRPERIELFWHLAPDWQVEDRGAEGLRLTCGDLILALRIEASVQGELSVVSGDLSEPLGWYSARYGHKVPCATIRWSGCVAEAELRTTVWACRTNNGTRP